MPPAVVRDESCIGADASLQRSRTRTRYREPDSPSGSFAHFVRSAGCWTASARDGFPALHGFAGDAAMDEIRLSLEPARPRHAPAGYSCVGAGSLLSVCRPAKSIVIAAPSRSVEITMRAPAGEVFGSVITVDGRCWRGAR